MAVGKAKRSAIPVGSQFTPTLFHLPAFLQALLAGSGEKAAIESAVWAPGVRKQLKAEPPTKRNRALPVEAAVQYGLLDKSYAATELTHQLAALTEETLYPAFARHILLKLGGLRVLEGIAQMEADQITVNGDSIARYLTAQGFNVVEHNTAINSLRMWLAMAGVFPLSKGKNAWSINPGIHEKLLGLSNENITALAGLNKSQLAFVEALCAAEPRKSYQAAAIRDLAVARRPDVRFNRSSLPKDILAPLAAAGIIKYKTKGTQGGKSSVFSTTEVFDREVLNLCNPHRP